MTFFTLIIRKFINRELISTIPLAILCLLNYSSVKRGDNVVCFARPPLGRLMVKLFHLFQTYYSS